MTFCVSLAGSSPALTMYPFTFSQEEASVKLPCGQEKLTLKKSKCYLIQWTKSDETTSPLHGGKVRGIKQMYGDIKTAHDRVGNDSVTGNVVMMVACLLLSFLLN